MHGLQGPLAHAAGVAGAGVALMIPVIMLRSSFSATAGPLPTHLIDLENIKRTVQAIIRQQAAVHLHVDGPHMVSKSRRRQCHQRRRRRPVMAQQRKLA